MKSLWLLVAGCVSVLALSGCITTTHERESQEELQKLRNQVTLLESQVQAKDEEITMLHSKTGVQIQQGASVSQAYPAKFVGEVKSRPTMRQIQIALANAGYDPGPADGKHGTKTREAVKQFQKANNLPADGKVGAITWAVLSPYLYKREQQQ